MRSVAAMIFFHLKYLFFFSFFSPKSSLVRPTQCDLQGRVGFSSTLAMLTVAFAPGTKHLDVANVLA